MAAKAKLQTLHLISPVGCCRPNIHPSPLLLVPTQKADTHLLLSEDRRLSRPRPKTVSQWFSWKKTHILVRCAIRSWNLSRPRQACYHWTTATCGHCVLLEPIDWLCLQLDFPPSFSGCRRSNLELPTGTYRLSSHVAVLQASLEIVSTETIFPSIAL